MDIVLTRLYAPGGTNGTLTINGSIICYTIELPWLNNRSKVSCIPEGRYRLLIRYSLKHKGHFILQNVKDRTLILIHPANNAATELQGCIAPVTVLTAPGVGTGSRWAFNKLKNIVLNAMEQSPVFLIIKS